MGENSIRATPRQFIHQSQVCVAVLAPRVSASLSAGGGGAAKTALRRGGDYALPIGPEIAERGLSRPRPDDASCRCT